jgi:hypothetical protein
MGLKTVTGPYLICRETVHNSLHVLIWDGKLPQPDLVLMRVRSGSHEIKHYPAQ